MPLNPVSPSEGRPAKPSKQATEQFLAEVEATAATDAYNTFAAQVPPVMQEEFLSAHPMPPGVAYPPVDEEDVRQSESKRGPPAPNEPPSYVDPQGNPIDPTVLPPEAPPPDGGEGGVARANPDPNLDPNLPPRTTPIYDPVIRR